MASAVNYLYFAVNATGVYPHMPIADRHVGIYASRVNWRTCHGFYLFVQCMYCYSYGRPGQHWMHTRVIGGAKMGICQNFFIASESVILWMSMSDTSHGVDSINGAFWRLLKRVLFMCSFTVMLFVT